MAEDHNRDQDHLPDSWHSPWEQECADNWETETNMDEILAIENETSAQKLWLSFQNCATSIAQLYKERHVDRAGVSPWVPFQNSASSVTVLYKDSLEAAKRKFELGVQCGGARRTKDILAWARKRRRHIRREDLIAYLCGKSPPPRSKPSPTLPRAGARLTLDKSSPKLHHSSLHQVEPRHTAEEPDLQPFKDALALQGLNGSMANISMGYKPELAEGDEDRETYNSDIDFNCFIMDEITRRCDRKRMSSSDTRLDSPSRKRNRLL